MFLTFISLATSANLFTSYEEKSFVSWMRSTNQIYTGNEYNLRFGIYMCNKRYALEHNKASKSFRVALNKYAAYTTAEYSALLGFKADLQSHQRRILNSNQNAFNANPSATIRKSEAFDWRTKNVVNPIKDQGNCGSCWSFSVIQSVETVDAIATGKLLRLSEQNLVDCAYRCHHCLGGVTDLALNYVLFDQDGKFNLENEYPYIAVQAQCKFSEKQKVGSMSAFNWVASGNEDDLAEKCETYGPISVAIDAAHTSFQLYISGIYDEPDCNKHNLDHAVGVIGFGFESDAKYFIVRNSWGLDWGEEGYIRMAWKENQCGIASYAIYPIA